MRYRIRTIAFLGDLDRQKMQLAMLYPLHGNNMIGEFFYVPDSSAQNSYFQAIIMVHMYVHGRYNQVMMPVLCRSNATRQFGRVYIAERGYAMILNMLFQANGIQQLPYQVAHGFRAVEITAPVHYRIKLLRELIIKRYSETFHVYLLQDIVRSGSEV